MHKYINPNNTRSSALLHSTLSILDSDAVNDIGVFLLGTLSGSVHFGERHPKEDSDYYFERIIAAKHTWAKHLTHFYMVTADGTAEKRILKSPIYCNNTHSSKFAGGLNHSYKLFVCSGIHILHLPHCSRVPQSVSEGD